MAEKKVNQTKVSHPLVSVCIPTYNRAWCLKEAIDCALNQATSLPYEVLIVDNASTDDTAKIVRSYTDSRLRYECNATNIGIIPNHNRCLELARGDYITIWGDDDFVSPDYVAAHARALDENPMVGLAYSAYQEAPMHGGKCSAEVWPFRYSHVWSSEQELRFITRRGYILAPMMRRMHLHRVGLFNTQITAFWADWEMWIRFAMSGGMAYIARIFYTKRFHVNQTGDSFYREEDQTRVRAILDERYHIVDIALHQNELLDSRYAQELRARRYCENAKSELLSALSALRHGKGKEFGTALKSVWYWQINKAGWRYLLQTISDMIIFLRKRWRGRTKYVFDLE